ncbi:MAG: histidine kinase, partial [Clostridia bacterium]|nr:histidine kinase [Clostridia bacterium]
MTDLLFLPNYSILLIAITLSFFGVVTTILIQDANKIDRRYFLIFFILLGCSSLAQMVCEFSKSALLSQVTLFISSLLSSTVMVPLISYMLHCAGKKWRTNPFFITAIVLWAVYFILLIVTQFTKIIYYFTPDNEYHRGPLYPLLLLPVALFMLLNVICLFIYRNALSRRQRLSFLSCFVIPLICMAVQMAFYGLLLIAYGATLAVFFMLMCFLFDQSEKSIRRAEENALQQASIQVLQMRPHFICNTMMSIYYLIPQDAEKAQQVTLDFTTYLRNNFTAIAAPDTIPFEKELEHTRAFLSVEMVR